MNGCRPLEKQEWDLVFYSVRGVNALRTRALMILMRKTGFRISEVLSLRIGDLFHEGAVVKSVTVARQSMKGGKKKGSSVSGRTILLHPDTHKHLIAQYESLKARGFWRPDDYFFQSRGRGNRAIRREQAWKDFVHPVRRRRIPGRVGTHGIGRKTFAKEILEYLTANWQPGREVPFQVLQRCTGHATQEALMHYIPWADKEAEEAILNT